jgi:hypothetical protein
MVKYFEAETRHGMPRHTRLHVSVAKRFLRRCEKLFFEVDENRAHSRSCLDGSNVGAIKCKGTEAVQSGLMQYPASQHCGG